MMYPAFRKLIGIIVCFGLITMTNVIKAQGSDTLPNTENPDKKVKPFRILTDGNRITVQSKVDIDRIMVWTANGNRYIEQTNINTSSYNFTIPSKEKFVFLMLQLKNGKHYTEKVGAQ